MAQRAWWLVSGGYSRRIATWRLSRVTRDPQTFTEKLHYKMAFDRRPLLTLFADKIAVREHVAAVIGAEYLTQMYCSSSDPGDIDWLSLPEEFACKPNHMSGVVVLVTRDAPVVEDSSVLWQAARAGYARVHPSQVDPVALTQLCRHWLDQDYGWSPGRRPEWAYRNINRAILVEELLPPQIPGDPPQDCRFLVFNGRVALIRATDRSEAEQRRYSMTPDWQSLAVTLGHENSVGIPLRPNNLEEMVDLASRLGRGVDFVRVDLYSLGDRVVFGELTNYPLGGSVVVRPKEFDVFLGKQWIIEGYGHAESRPPETVAKQFFTREESP